MQTKLPEPKYYICSLASQAVRKMVAHYNRALGPFGLTAQQVMALAVLWKEDGLSLGIFAKRAGIGKAAAVTMIKRLEDMELVKKKIHPKDARLNVLTLTEKAHKLAPNILSMGTELEKSIVSYSELGVKVMITELDISVLPWPELAPGAEVKGRFKYRPELDPYKENFPDSAQEELAERYADIFRVFVKHADKISRVTFWGINDGTSWKNNFPVRGRTDFPLLFDRDYLCKPAFHAVIATAKP